MVAEIGTMTNFPRTAATLLFFCVLSAGVVATPIANSEYAQSTLVVYNETSPESRALAVFYVKQRGLPIDHVVGLDCSMEETITREEFTETIAKPLRKFMTENGLWKLGDVGGGKAASECKIHIVALMRGVPMRIAATPLEPTGKVDAEGKAVPPVKNKQFTDEASVDSELVLLSLDTAPTKSMGRNPYFEQQQAKSAVGIAPMMLVGRIDGPDWETAQRLIEDAVAAEKTGLWGNAYIDLSRMDVTKGPGYKIGDEWLRKVAGIYGKLGIPTYVDGRSERFPDHFPLGEDAILYFGWYANNADGPFRHGDFKFKRGAVACHIQSYSATTLRTKTGWWVGPLLSRGAAAVLGNVYEPFLTYTTHLDVFNSRLLEGYTFIEAAWMATPGVSWMNVMVGDPLYQPFLPGRDYGKQPDADFKALRLAVGRWGDEPEVLFEKLDFAAEKLKSAEIHEAAGLRHREALKFDKAAAAFAKAREMFQGKADKLRMEIYRIELLRSNGKKQQAVAELRKILPDYQDIPESQAVEAIINQIDPPPPPPPPPPAK